MASTPSVSDLGGGAPELVIPTGSQQLLGGQHLRNHWSTAKIPYTRGRGKAVDEDYSICQTPVVGARLHILSFTLHSNSGDWCYHPPFTLKQEKILRSLQLENTIFFPSEGSQPRKL